MKKYIFAILALAVLAGCSSAPTKYLRQNCEDTNIKGAACPLNSLCYCEDVPNHDREPRNR